MIDPTTAVWVAEFILRQPVDDWIAHEIFFALPLPSPMPHRLRLTILLRRLASDLSRGSPSLRTLHSLDLILDHRPPSTSSFFSSSSQSMAAAYRAVSLHCLVLLSSSSSSDNVSFTTFVDGLSSRVVDLERAEPATLPSEPLRELKMEIEAAAGSGAVRQGLLERDMREEALDAIRDYLKAATEELGPSFLELAAEAVVRGETGLGEASGDALAESGEKDKDSGAAGGVGEGNFGLSNAAIDHDNQREVVHPETSSTPSHILDKYMEIEMDGEQDAAAQLGNPSDKFDPLPTLEVEKVANALKSSCTDLHKVVVDPLPDAVKQAAEVSMLVVMKSDKEQKEIQCQKGTSTPVCALEEGAMDNIADGTMVQSMTNDDDKSNRESSAEKQSDGNENRVPKDKTDCVGTEGIGISNIDSVPKRSLMDRNPTAHTYEWGEDPIESSSDKSSASSKKISLPSPTKRKVSPLRMMENKTFVRRRKVKKWSLQEEDTLRKAVEKHGRGNWKTILNSYSDIFEDRTEVDLKDKWRNMTRH